MLDYFNIIIFRFASTLKSKQRKGLFFINNQPKEAGMLNTEHFSQNAVLEEIKNIDPRLIVGIATSQTEVIIATLEKLLPISEKVTIPLPREVFLGHTRIKSVQQILTSEVGYVTIMEIIGELSVLAKTVAKQIARRMAELGIIHCFFPVYTEEAGDPFICYNLNQRFVPLSVSARNIRIAHMHALFFVYNRKEIRQISFRHAYKKEWLNHSQLLFRSGKKSLFSAG